MRMVRDDHSPPGIDETLDCLNWVKLFTVFDLKLGYWQVELDELVNHWLFSHVVP